jgi:hypothetical protein
VIPSSAAATLWVRWPGIRRETALATGFYFGLLGLILGCVTQVFPHALPHDVATRIMHNSEGYVAPLVLGAWIQFARPRLRGSALQWPATLAAGAACFAVGLLLVMTDRSTPVKALNEAFFAAAILIPYVQVRRPLPPGLAAGMSAGVLALIVVGHDARGVTLLAETWGMLVLAPIGLDVVDRGILDPQARTSRGARHVWYAALVIAPIVFSALQYHIGDTGTLEVVTRYAVRLTEAFVFLLFLELYFAVGLRRGRQVQD